MNAKFLKKAGRIDLRKRSANVSTAPIRRPRQSARTHNPTFRGRPPRVAPATSRRLCEMRARRCTRRSAPPRTRMASTTRSRVAPAADGCVPRSPKTCRRRMSDRAMSFVMHSRRADDRADESSSPCADTEVHVFEAEEVCLVEVSDSVQHVPLDQHHATADRIDRLNRRWRCLRQRRSELLMAHPSGSV